MVGGGIWEGRLLPSMGEERRGNLGGASSQSKIHFLGLSHK